LRLKKNIVNDQNKVYHEKFEEINDSKEQQEQPSFRMSYLGNRVGSGNSGSDFGESHKPVTFISQERYKRSNTDQSPHSDRSVSSISVSERIKFGISNQVIKQAND
jgi:hypothetical protein